MNLWIKISCVCLLLNACSPNKLFVFDDAKEFAKFSSDPANAKFLKNKKIVSDDEGLMNLLKNSGKRNLGESIPTCTCTCTIDSDDNDSDSCSSCSGQNGGSSDSNKPAKPDRPVKEGQNVFNVLDLRPNTMYCLINIFSKKVAKVEADLILKQQNNASCTGATGLMLTDLEYGHDSVTARIYEKNSQLFLFPTNPNNNLGPIGLTLSDENDAKQKWKIYKAEQYSNANETWFFIQNIGTQKYADVLYRSSGRANIINHPLNKSQAQVFAFKVIRNL